MSCQDETRPNQTGTSDANHRSLVPAPSLFFPCASDFPAYLIMRKRCKFPMPNLRSRIPEITAGNSLGLAVSARNTRKDLLVFGSVMDLALRYQCFSFDIQGHQEVLSLEKQILPSNQTTQIGTLTKFRTLDGNHISFIHDPRLRFQQRAKT